MTRWRGAYIININSTIDTAALDLVVQRGVQIIKDYVFLQLGDMMHHIDRAAEN